MLSVHGVTRFATVALSAAVVATSAQSAGAGSSAPAPGQPRPGRVLLGVVGPDPAAFDRLTRHRHKLHLVFVNGGGAGLSKTLEADSADGRITIVTLNGQSSPAAFARGDFDGLLTVTSEAANAVGTPVWIRPVPEMNGHWSEWAAFDRSGRPRGAQFSTTQFKRAFQRIALIMRGGPVAKIDRRLRALGMPPLRGVAVTDLTSSGEVAMLWNPQGQGSPNVPGNQPKDFWPGAGYVDYVGNDLYEIRGRAYWPGMDALYNAFRKPFVIGEWAPWGYDSPEFVRQMFAWVAAHPRTVGLVYFNKGWSGGGGTFELRTKRRSLAAYRQAANAPRFAG
jgi:hypothetical protein